jgi:predicted DNA-binding transcriptional regulator YafY
MQPGSGRTQGRAPLERMLRIHQAVQAGEYPTSKTLAAEFEVSTKCVQRDIEFMRDRLRLPIDFDFQRNGFRYTEEVSSFPALQITEGELFALVIAEKALQQYRGTSFEQPLLSAVRKMQKSLPDTISISLDEVDRTISFRTRAEPILDLAIFDILAKATAAREQLEITYRKPGAAQPELRLIDPYHLANINGEWFLFAFDHLRKDIRTFVPARMKAVRKTGRSFPKPQKFSLDQRLHGSFGVRSGEGSYEVVLRFDAKVADYIREKKWHESQQLRELKQGHLELRMRLSSLAEVERWVLNWAGHAVVVKPPELARSVAEAARRILAVTEPPAKSPG